MPDRIGELAAMDGYSPEEADFQFGVRATPWFGEFAQQHGEPNLNDPNYDYRAAWTAGARPNVRDPGDNQLHWSSQFKGAQHPNRIVNGIDTITGQPVSTGEEYAGLGGDPSHLATTIKNWWTNQPSWLDRAKAENQKTLEAYGRGGMGEIAKQLATDTTEPQELYGAFGVGNISRVRGVQLPGNEGLSYLLGRPSQIDLIGKERGALNPNGISRLSVANAPEGYGSDRLVYTKDGQIVGAMQITKTPDATPTIANTFVHPDYRRQGIATELNNQANSIYGNLSRSEGPSDAGEAFRKSLGKMGELAAVDEYRPPFYSAVEQAVQGAKQNAAPGQQWAGFLRNQPGVKQEEVQALGLGKLFEQPSVSKEAMLGEIAANRVNVGEVMKTSGKRSMTDIDREITDLYRQHPDYDQNPALLERYNALQAEFKAAQDPPTKFQQYTLPGGENYREMLLTLPEKKPPAGEMPMGFKLVNENEAARAAGYNVPADGVERWTYSGPGIGSRVFNSRDEAIADAARYSSHEKNPQAFHSSHYDEPNILAHVRYNDRVIDGKKTLFVEEVQSDWHQKGKREGYQLPSERTAPMDSEYRALVHKNADARAAGQEPLPADVARAQELEAALMQSDRSKIPDAPFKTTWPELAMKRIIREAAEKGYDKVAWTPGSVQAARYPEQLRQHVDEIAWSSPGTPRSNPEGLRYVHAKPRAGGMDLVFTVNKDGMITEASAAQAKGQHVEDIFGKDMSRQIMERADGEIASKDFVIGAKGQQGFYDEILPATVNKLVKKHGGRVSMSDPAKASSAPMNDIAHELGYGGWHTGLTKEQKAHIESVWNENQSTPRAAVHMIDITPSLRAAAMKGFPLFSAGGVAATGAIGELARQDEYQ